jgi:anti-sigma B factor antagonist
VTTQDRPDDYEVSLQPTPDGLLVAIGGELDLANAGFLRDQLVEAVRDHPQYVRVDLADLSFIDSSAVGLLVAMKRNVNDYGGHFSVRCGGEGHLALARRGLLDHLNVDFAG